MIVDVVVVVVDDDSTASVAAVAANLLEDVKSKPMDYQNDGNYNCELRQWVVAFVSRLAY